MDTILLGIDYGRKHCGLAVSEAGLAEPIETVSTDAVMTRLAQLINTHQVGAIVVGMSEGAMAAESIAFAQRLHDETGLPVFGHDETLTSYETRQQMAQAGLKKSRREAKMDHLVAAAILQDFIDSYATLAQIPSDAMIGV